MANHKSALKRIRQASTRRTHNRYYGKTMRNAVRDFRALDDAAKAEETLPQVTSLIDRMAGKGHIHKNKAANLKHSLAEKLNSLKGQQANA